MFNNFINRHDFIRLIWGLRHGYLGKIISRLNFKSSSRVIRQWSEKKQQVSSWWMLPEVGRHTNRLVSGDEKTNYYQYVSQQYFSDKTNVVGLSLGCGKGQREPIWERLIDFQRIDAFDISPTQIEIAKKNAAEKKLDHVINYQAKDIMTCDFEENSYDVIFVEQSLHHFSPLWEILQRIAKVLKPDGLFVINEFVGPNRFQWTDRQLEVSNALRKLFPPEYRRHVVDGSLNKKIIRPSRLSMLMKDPSEAIESSNIIPFLKKQFEIVDYKPYNATISHILFDGIAHNMVGKEEAKPLINLCLELEHSLIKMGDLESDYALVVCRKN